MKLKSLILGSVAAAGLSTAGYAADLGVLTSLDVCDALGLSGLTISSDTNCLQISGEVSYEFNWGDFDGDTTVALTPSALDEVQVPNPGGDDLLDWDSHIEAWLTVIGTADSDFGPAKAVIKIGTEDDDYEVEDEATVGPTVDGTHIVLDEAYVSVGSSTVLMAGRKGSIAVDDDDEPFNYLGLFNSEAVDAGVDYVSGDFLGGHVIQVVSDLGNGVSVGVGLENLEGQDSPAVDPTTVDGTLVGVVSYAGESLTAHLTGVAVGVLDGEIDEWAAHAGATGTFDMFKVRGAFGYNSFDDGVDAFQSWNALASAEATFDIFTLAASAEYVSNERTDLEGWGFGASIGAEVVDGIAINLGGRYFDAEYISTGASEDAYQIGAQLVAAVTETIELTGEIGVYGGETVENNFADDQVYYGAAELAWNPGGDFSSSIRGEVYSTEAYKVTFEASKSFQ